MKFIKNNIKLILGIRIGMIISGTGVYAATILFQGDQVGFDNTNAGITLNNQSVDNVQDAIDAIYTKVNTDLSTCNTNYSTCSSSLTTAEGNYSTCSSSLSTCQTNLANAPIAKNNTVYYAFGTPTTSSTTDYTTLNKNVFVALNGSQKSVCIIRNSKLHCFDNNNWPIEKDHVQQVFSDISCDVYSSDVDCTASDFRCYVTSDGRVSCTDRSTSGSCHVYGDGSVYCY